MKVIEIKHVEDCFDGSLIKELLLSDVISQKHILALGNSGNLQYFDHFARPFFKIRSDDLFDIKGIEGNKTMRIHIKNPERYDLRDFIELLEKCDF